MLKNDPSKYRIVYFSWAHIWVPFLEALNDDPRFDVIWVVTMPDVARDRWQKKQKNIIKKLAESKEIPVKTPYSLRTESKKHSKSALEMHQWLTDIHADYFVVVAYGKLLPKTILDIPRFWAINVHWSLLPKYRWASPLQSVFLKGENETWITIMKMDEWMDTWDMLSKLKTPLPLDWTVKNLISRIEKKSPVHLMDTLWDYAKWEIAGLPQNEALHTKCNKIDKKDWLVEIENNSLESIYRKYQAYSMWPKVFFILKMSETNEKRVLIEDLVIDESIYDNTKKEALVSVSWSVYSLNPAIKDISIKVEGKKAITWEEFRSNYLTKL